MTSLVLTVETEIKDVIHEAKTVWLPKAETFLEGVAITAEQKAVALLKETTVGTAVANLISAASSASTAGTTKFAAVVAAGKALYDAFVDNGGLKGLLTSGVSVLRQLVQSLFDDFAAASAS